MSKVRKLLSGNEAIALGAYHAGVLVATAYPGTPSTEILENLAKNKDIYAEWSTNEKVAMEVGLGASYAGVRTMVSMKHVGLNVAADPFMAAATTGIHGGLVVISADDPGIHSSQGEQDNRHFAKLARVPMLEPSDSQEAYDFIEIAYHLSEHYDTPVLFRITTRVAHSKSVVEFNEGKTRPERAKHFQHNIEKYVMLPTYARVRVPHMHERMLGLTKFAETTSINQLIEGDGEFGIISSGVSYEYAREVFPHAAFLKLGMVYPLPPKLIQLFASKVKHIFVIEELDPFLEENIKILGVKVEGKKHLPRFGELNKVTVQNAAIQAGIASSFNQVSEVNLINNLPNRPPLLCPGCPHAGAFFVLSTIGQRGKILDEKGKSERESKLIITGDIGCYTLATYPPLRAMDTTACMGASIGQAIGLEKAGISSKIIAVIGDSTFMHSGITGIVDAVYNNSKITVLILDNGTTAMTGHQDHPGSGITVQGYASNKVAIENVVHGAGVTDVTVVNAFDIKKVRSAIRTALDNDSLSVVIVRGECAVINRNRQNQRQVDSNKCNDCGVCVMIGCSAIQKRSGKIFIDVTSCMGDACTICEQICPQQAIGHGQVTPAND
ncbi:MAG: indolepyruvate ferredoxin oxidoreductase subunit alpha [Dehalococcoidales bacterium]|nr:indolepyruvate ferredoxin oxidoreductase subunit alpha [Dehalococcoidales bacterium]